MKYLLVLFVFSASSPTAVPDVVDIPFESQTDCWNTGFTMFARKQSKIKWFNCVQVDELEQEPDER